ncbi:MAG: TSUP family transporter, partial [Acetobacteraceae bacterium]|nr:TSUP family transporter [Acetobacteraceae bacterium]
LRTAGATKNALAGIMNASAVVVFLFSPAVHWVKAAAVAAGAIAGGYAGAWLLLRINDRLLRVVVVLIGVGLTIGMFIREP